MALTGDVGARPHLSSTSLVPTADWISDAQARLQLATLWIDDPTHQAEARSLLERVLADQPTNLEARLQLIDLLLRVGRTIEADPHLNDAFAHRARQPARRPQLAELLIRAGRLSEALVVLREATTEAGPPPDLLVRQAEVALWTGQLVEARAALDRLSAVPDALVWQVADLEGQLALQSGDLAAAEAAWTKALSLLNEDARGLEKERRSAENRRLRRQLALVISWRNQTARAVPALEAALLDDPGDAEVRRELGRQYLRAADLASAEATVKPLTAGPSPSSTDLALWGDICLAQGRFVDFREAYEQALLSQTTASATPALERRWADALTAAGDHARALPIYRRLAAAPADLDPGLALAWSLASAERYAEARQVCAILRLHHPMAPRLALLEGRIRLLEMDFTGALAWGATAAAAAPAGSPEAFSAHLLQAEAWLGSGYPASAAAALAPLPLDGRLDDPHPIEALVDLHRLLDLTGQATAARQLLDALEPQHPLHPYLRLARLLAKFGDGTSELEQAIARDLQTPPRHLADWGQELMRRQRLSAAEAAFRRALERQPDCLPARLGLVMLLAATERRGEALHTLVLPDCAPHDHFLVRLWQARLLAWDRRYAEAREAYRRLRQADPEDPVVQRESARLAFWSKRPDEARTLYRNPSRPAADSQIAERLHQHGLTFALGSALVRPPDWDGWDRLAELARDSNRQLSSETRLLLEEILASTLADARQQKIFDLEERAKRAVWEGRLRASLLLFRHLLQTEPGNLEARFDLSQVQNRLGLRDHEAASYREILRLDPLHSLVRHAQRKHQAVGRPLLRMRFDRWTEEGRGELARMTWWRWRLEGETALGPRWRLGVGQNRWEYHPGLFGGSFQAAGPSLALRGVFNPWLRLDASWQRQEFASDRRILGQSLPDRDAGQLGLRATVGDRLDIGLGLDRIDQFVNDIGLRDGLQARQRWLSATWSAHRRFQMQGRWTRQDLTDDNHGRLFEWEGGYRLAEHPRLWRLVLSGEARNTDRPSVLTYRQGRLVDILHPYWTPQSYRSRALTLHHQADLSKRLLASTDHHQIDMRLTRLDDTDDNRATRLELTWHYEFAWRWAIELRGMIHRSRQWDASSLGFLLERNF